MIEPRGYYFRTILDDPCELCRGAGSLECIVSDVTGKLWSRPFFAMPLVETTAKVHFVTECDACAGSGYYLHEKFISLEEAQEHGLL